MPNRFAASLRLSPSIITACLTLAYSSTVNILPAPPCQSPASERPSRTGTLLRRCHTAAHSRFSGTLCLRDLYPAAPPDTKIPVVLLFAGTLLSPPVSPAGPPGSRPDRARRSRRRRRSG